MTGFAAATAARRLGEGRYEVVIDPAYVPDATQAPLGGYLIAVLLRAVLERSSHPYPVAVTAHFLSRGTVGPAEVILDPLRAGRTVATTRASVRQHGRTLVEALVTTATFDREAAPAWTTALPGLPPVGECMSVDPGHPLSPGRRFLEQLDVRFDPATMGWLEGRPPGMPEIRGYFRLREDYPPDPYLIALAIDAKPPVTVGVGVIGAWSTVELTMHMRAAPAAGWLVLRSTGRLIRDGWFDETVEVWDSAGAVVAQCHQIGRVVT